MDFNATTAERLRDTLIHERQSQFLIFLLVTKKSTALELHYESLNP